ncbi:MAG: AMP-binding protein [Actinomycetota bacterium]|nr:AMP-binding protein [Actinomycetota bacterium]
METLEGFTPWPPETAETYRRKGYWQGKTFGELLHEWADRYGDREAVVGGEKRLSYVQLAEKADRLAWQLLHLGIKKNDRVVVQMPNVPEFSYLCFALLRIGALPVLALPAHREREVSHFVQFSEATAYVIASTFRDFDYEQMAREVKSEAPTLTHVLVVDEATGSFTASGEPLEEPGDMQEVWEELDRHHPDASDVALFQLSGGTSGLPKLIPRTHDDYAYNARESASVCGFGPETRYLAVLPSSHNFPLACPGLLGTLHVGGTAVMASTPDPETVFPLIERERVTATAVVPALAIRWMNSDLLGDYDLSSLELLQVGGSRLNPETAHRISSTLGCLPQQVFGMAEGLLNYTRLDDPDEVIAETQGRPMSPDDEVRIVDPEGNDVAPGEAGELITRGPYTLRGYYKAEEKNREAFTPDGFYRTGDIVRWHPSSNLVVEGRDKDLINRGGEMISAEEVENLILSHPRIHNVAAVAMPDPVMGEKTCAYVVPKGGETISLEEMLEFLKGKKVAKYKLPERLELLKSLPLTNVGKIDKKALREDVTQKLETEGALSR